MSKRVRGTMDFVSENHVDVDTVYLRYNIQRIETEEFTGWEYDEIQYPLRKYIEKLLQTEVGQLMIAQNTAETIEVISFLDEQRKIEQAQSNVELIDLILSLQGGM